MVIQSKFVLMNINHGYKQYLFNQIFKIVKIKSRISRNGYEYVLNILNSYFDKLNSRRYYWSQITYPVLMEKLTKVSEILIKEEAEKEAEELSLINREAERLSRQSIL